MPNRYALRLRCIINHSLLCLKVHITEWRCPSVWGYWHERADETLGDHQLLCDQKPYVVKDENGFLVVHCGVMVYITVYALLGSSRGDRYVELEACS